MTDIEIREVRPDDAQDILDLVAAAASDPTLWIKSTLPELDLNVPDEVKYIEGLLSAPTSHGIVACAPHVIGFLAASGGDRLRTRHNVNIGLSVREEFRNQGVGRRMIEALLDWARENELVRRVELTVIAGNTPGLHLYRSLGFEVEGVMRGAFQRDGELHDEYMMAVML